MNTENHSLPTARIVKGFISFAITAVLLCVASLFVKSDKMRHDEMIAIQKQYSKLHDHPESWIISEVPKKQFVEMACDVVWKEGEKYRKLLFENCGVSETTDALWDEFGNFGVTLYLGKVGDKPITVARPTEKDLEGLRKGKEITFVPERIVKEYIRQHGYFPPISWQKDVGVTVFAIDWPSKFLVGALYHELYHGSKHKVGSNGFLNKDSDEYAIEEMEAHSIESVVLNHVTGGVYFERFDDIIRRVGNNPKDLVSEISIDDLKFFDQIFEMEKSGGHVASLAIAQHTFGLAMYQLRGTDKKEWAKFYKWAISSGAFK